MNGRKRAELKDIHKVFETPADGAGAAKTFAALDGVTLSFLPGEIHTILGENGAGKSTLVNILAGMHQPTSGRIRIGGQDIRFKSPSDALSAGVAMVHQRPLLAEGISALDNILLGSPGPFLRRSRRLAEIDRIANLWRIRLDYAASAGSLTASDRLRTALLGALWRSPDFLILDEPTAVLAPEEREEFCGALRSAAERGLGVILITHKIDEAIRWSDRVSVLRHGRLVYTSPIREPRSGAPVTAELLESILNPPSGAEPEPHIGNGRAIAQPPDAPLIAGRMSVPEPIGFAATAISAAPANRNPVREVSFPAAEGTITGIFGLPGSGIETLEDVLSGMLKPESGSISVGPETLGPAALSPAALRARGMAFVPSDRSFRGSHPALSISDLLTPYRETNVASAGARVRAFPFIRSRRENEAFCRELLAAERIEASPERSVQTLSGGQLQRLILARELSLRPRVLVLAEPEWGLDIRSAAQLRERLRAAAADGMTVIILSDDPDSFRESGFFSARFVLREGRLS